MMKTILRTLVLVIGALGLTVFPVAAQETLKISRSYDLSELELVDDESWDDAFSLGEDSTAYDAFDDEDDSELWKSLLRFLREELADLDWNRKGFYKLNGDILTIVATPNVHKRVRSVLLKLIESGAERARVKVSVVTLKDQSTTFADFQPGVALTKKQLRRLREETQAGNGVLFFDMTNGAKKVSRKLTGRNYLADYEVNQTGVTPVLNPVVNSLRVGLQGEIKGHWDGDSNEILLEARLETCSELSSTMAVFDKIRRIELPKVARLRLGTSVCVGLDSTTILAQFIDRQGKKRVVLASVRGKRVEALSWRRYSLSGIGNLQDFKSRSWRSGMTSSGDGVGLNFGVEEKEALRPELRLFQSLFKETVIGTGVIGTRLFVRDQKVRDYVGLALRNRLAKRTRLSYRVVELELPTGDLPEARQFDGVAFAKLRAAGKTTGEMSLSGFLGQQVHLDVFEQQSYLSEISTEGGGCLLVPPTPDPIVLPIVRGTRFRLEGTGVVEDTVSFELSGQSHSFGIFQEKKMKYGVIQLPQDVVRNEFVEKATVKWGSWAIVSVEGGEEKTKLRCVQVRRLVTAKSTKEKSPR